MGGLTVGQLLEYIEENDISPDAEIHVSAVTQRSRDGDWRTSGRAGSVSFSEFQGPHITIRGI